MKCLIALVMALIFCILNTEAQGTPALSKRAQTVRSRIALLSPGSKISVVRLQADEEYGTFISSTDTEFSFYNVDSKSPMTLRFEEFKKIKDGYGGYNSLRGRHTDRTKAMVVVFVLAGALAGLLVAVALSK